MTNPKMETATCSQLKEILALSLRNDFYKDDIWNLITDSKVDHKKFEVRYFVKTENDKVIGFIITTERTDLWWGKILLEYMLVDEKHRGKGVGQEMLDDFVSWADSNAKTSMKVQFPPTKMLLHFYGKNGFKELELEYSAQICNLVNWYKML